MRAENSARGGLFFRFHRGEEDNVADRRAVGEQHYESIQAHTQAACGRQAVFERVDKVLVHLRVVVALSAFRLNLFYHALFLVDRVV